MGSATLLGGHVLNLDCFFFFGGGGSFSEKEALPGRSFNEKCYKEIFSCYISEEKGKLKLQRKTSL